MGSFFVLVTHCMTLACCWLFWNSKRTRAKWGDKHCMNYSFSKQTGERQNFLIRYLILSNVWSLYGLFPAEVCHWIKWSAYHQVSTLCSLTRGTFWGFGFNHVGVRFRSTGAAVNSSESLPPSSSVNDISSMSTDQTLASDTDSSLEASAGPLGCCRWLAACLRNPAFFRGWWNLGGKKWWELRDEKKEK